MGPGLFEQDRFKDRFIAVLCAFVLCRFSRPFHL